MTGEMQSGFYERVGTKLYYYEIPNAYQPLVLVHAQGVDSTSYANTFRALSRKYHSGIPHEEILRNIKCETIFMKAQTNKNDEGLLMAALDEEDLERVSQLVGNCSVVRFDCGHGIHIEKEREFIQVLIGMS